MKREPFYKKNNSVENIFRAHAQTFAILASLFAFTISGFTNHALASSKQGINNSNVDEGPLSGKSHAQLSLPVVAQTTQTEKATKKSGERSWKGVITKSDSVSNKASPEVGYGDKTEEQIMQEKPRAPRIGALGPMSGELESFGIEASNGAELASDEINSKGGIKNKEFELLVFDTKGQMLGARKGVETFIRYKTIAVVGAATGEVSFAANKDINDNQLIMISAGSRRRLGDTGPYNFRNTLNDRDAIKSFVEYIARTKQWKRFVLFSSVINDYSIHLNAIFKAELLKKNMEVTNELYLWSDAMANIMPEERSVGKQISKITGDVPDAIIFTGDAKEAADVIKAMQAQGIHAPIIGSEELIKDEYVSLGKLVEGTLVYSGFDPDSDNPKVRTFADAYKRRFGSKPTRLAALSYDSYYMLSEAIKNAKSLRPSHVRKALLEIKDFEGVTGKTKVGPTGEAIKEPFIFELGKKGGKSAFVRVN